MGCASISEPESAGSPLVFASATPWPMGMLLELQPLAPTTRQPKTKLEKDKTARLMGTSLQVHSRVPQGPGDPSPNRLRGYGRSYLRGTCACCKAVNCTCSAPIEPKSCNRRRAVDSALDRELFRRRNLLVGSNLLETVGALEARASRGAAQRPRPSDSAVDPPLRRARRRRGHARVRDPEARRSPRLDAEPPPEAPRRRRPPRRPQRGHVPLLHAGVPLDPRAHGLRLGRLLQARQGEVLLTPPTP